MGKKLRKFVAKVGGSLACMVILSLLCSEGGLAKITIKFWLCDFNDDTIVLIDKKLIPEFEQKNPGIEIKSEYIAWGRPIETKLATAFAAGWAPDIYTGGAETVGLQAKRGMCMAMDEYFKTWEGTEDVYENLWDSCRYEGKTYGVPMCTAGRGMLYRQDLLDEAGVQWPETWDELATVGIKLTKKDPRGNIIRSGFNLPMSWVSFQDFMFSAGGNIVNPKDRTKVTINDSSVVETLQFWSDLYNKYKVCPRGGMPTVGGTLPLIGTGLVAMQYGHPIQLCTVKKYSPEVYKYIRFSVLPKKKVYKSLVCTDRHVISTQCTNPDAAWKWIEFLMEPDNLSAYNETMSIFPTRKACGYPEWMEEYGEPMRKAQEVMIKYGQGFQPIPEWDMLREALKEAIEEACYQRKTPQEALDNLAEKIEKAIAE